MTPVQMLLEKERRQAEHIASLGPRPPWWRPFKRARFDRHVLFVKQMHANDLKAMLGSPSEMRGIMAGLIGWKP